MAVLCPWNGSSVAIVTPAVNASPHSCSHPPVHRPGPARNQVQQPRPRLALLVAGQVDHPGQLLRALFQRAHVVPHVLIDAKGLNPVEPGRIGVQHLQQRPDRATPSSTPCRADGPTPGSRRARGAAAVPPTTPPVAQRHDPARRAPHQPRWGLDPHPQKILSGHDLKNVEPVQAHEQVTVAAVHGSGRRAARSAAGLRLDPPLSASPRPACHPRSPRQVPRAALPC